MDKVKEIEASFNHGISLAERKNVVVTGVKVGTTKIEIE